MFMGLHIHFPEPVVKHLHGGAGVNGNPVIECDRADLLEQIADIGVFRLKLTDPLRLSLRTELPEI